MIFFMDDVAALIDGRVTFLSCSTPLTITRDFFEEVALMDGRWVMFFSFSTPLRRDFVGGVAVVIFGTFLGLAESTASLLFIQFYF